MRWVEGLTLDKFVEEHLKQPRNLKMLLELWPKLAARLREAHVAHADLQHGNVLLVPQDHGALALRLVDYDGMYVPSLAGTRSGEVGHPAYQHPQRLREGTYNGDVDRFSHLAIYTSIRCLIGGHRELWQQFNNRENLLFRETDFAAPSQSPLFRTLWQSADQEVRSLVGRLALGCGQRLEEVPWLDDVVVKGQVQPLTREEESQVAQMLAVGKATAAPGLPLLVGEGGGKGSAAASSVQPPSLPLERIEPATTTAGTHPATAEGTMPVTPPLGGRFRAVGKWLLGSSAAATRPLDRLLRYSIWTALSLLFLLAIWAGLSASTHSPVPWKLRPISPQTVEAGKPFSVTATVENSAAWEGKLRFSLGPQSPAGTTINTETGELTWTPTRHQASGKYEVTVSAETPNGRHDQTTLIVNVTVSVPLKLKPIAPKTIEAGKSLSVTVALENAEVWKGKVRYSLSSPALPGMSIGAATGIFTWTPTEGQAADKHNVAVLATGPDGRRDETRFVVNVLKPIPPLRLRPISPQTVEAGKPLSVTATVENSAAWEGKLQFSLGPQSPAGTTINAQTGQLTWTPPPDQPAQRDDVTVSVQGPDGQTAKTTFVVIVTRPLEKQIALDLGNGIKLELVLIPAGEFMMGSPDSDKNALLFEKPQHRVRITKPFYLGKYLVTQEQWEAVMGDNPSHFKGPKNPVETICWNDCQKFVEKLNAKVGGGKFSLPTEAQWEYACRAGSTTRYCFGNEESGLDKYAWHDADSDSKPHRVGEKKPNAWGLYDMHGNLWEWCQDWYDQDYYANSPTDDPTGPSGGSNRVLRGGCWYRPTSLCRSALRNYNSPGSPIHYLAFRVSRIRADTVAEWSETSRANDSAQPSGGSDANKSPLAPHIPADVASLRKQFPSARKLVSVAAYKASWSPNARQVSFSRNSDGGVGIVDVETLAVTTLIASGKDPAWSPRDANMIAFVRERWTRTSGLPPTKDEDIWITDASGKNAKRIAQGGWPVWAKDGKSLYFHSGKGWKIFQISVDPPGYPVAVCDAHNWYPPITADGKRTAYVDHDELVVLDIQTRKPLANRHLGKWPGFLAGWSPDGKLLGYGTYGGDSMIGLWMTNVDTAQVVRVAEGPFTAPAWSPDGSKLAFDRRGNDGWEIWMLDTKELEKLWDTN
jgi:formylglycine-generating enzyme required for sulfatase activity